MTLAHDPPIEPGLLFSLDALLQERSVSRAAARMGLTQSAMSRVLGRLREQLRDPLLVRAGRSMALSPRAEAMAAPLRRALAQVNDVLLEQRSFDPATSRRTFRIATVDYGVAVLVAPLIGAIAREAPGVAVVVEPLHDEVERDLQAGSLDLVLAPRRASIGSLVWTRLRSERFVSVARRSHPGLRRNKPPTLDEFCALGHIVVAAPERQSSNPVDVLVAQRGKTRRVALRVPSFLAAFLAVADSDLVFTTGETVARRFATAFDLRVFETPLALGPLSLSMGWHERQRNDPGHQWLRAKFLSDARSTPGQMG
jgi:DNA-binding transcriptional LysR family regulator